MNKQRMDVTQTLAVVELLRVNCEKVGETDFCRYKDGWNDKRIANMVGVSHNSVGRVRREILGDLKAGRGESNPNNVSVRLAHIEDFLKRTTSFEP